MKISFFALPENPELVAFYSCHKSAVAAYEETMFGWAAQLLESDLVKMSFGPEISFPTAVISGPPPWHMPQTKDSMNYSYPGGRTVAELRTFPSAKELFSFLFLLMVGV